MIRFYLREESFRYCWGDTHHNPIQGEAKEEIHAVCPRGGFAAFQAVAASDRPMLVCIGRSGGFSPYGQVDRVRIAVRGDDWIAQHVRMQLVGLVQDDDGTWKSDLLLNQDAIYCDKRLQQVWIELPVELEAEPGFHQGTVAFYYSRMFGQETLLKELRFSVNITGAKLPSPQNYKFYLDLWQHPCNIARKADVPYYSDAHFAVLEEYVKSLAELGQKAVSVIVSDVPWSGQNCAATENTPTDLFEYSMIETEKRDGVFFYDYSAMDRYITLCETYGIREEIEVFGLTGIWTFSETGYGHPATAYPEAIRIRYQENGVYGYLTQKEDVEAFVRALEVHFREQGWLDRVRIAADEPGDIEAYTRSLENLQALAPDFRIKAATNRVAFIKEFAGVVQDFVPMLSDLVQGKKVFDRLRQGIKGRTAFYVCCQPIRPNTYLSSPLLEARLLPVLAAWLGVDGFLRWSYTVWPEHPRTHLPYRSTLWKSGDTNFVYPGGNGSPLLSLRYKLLLRGIQDFELLQMDGLTPAQRQRYFEKLFFRSPGEFYGFDEQGFCDYIAPAEKLYSLQDEDYQKASVMLQGWVAETDCSAP